MPFSWVLLSSFVFFTLFVTVTFPLISSLCYQFYVSSSIFIMSILFLALTCYGNRWSNKIWENKGINKETITRSRNRRERKKMVLSLVPEIILVLLPGNLYVAWRSAGRHQTLIDKQKMPRQLFITFPSLIESPFYPSIFLPYFLLSFLLFIFLP